MPSGRENLALQIALIIFVMLTIVLAVTTFIFFKQTEEAQVARAEWEKKFGQEQAERRKSNDEIARLKELVAKGAGDAVDVIMDEFDRHKNEYGATMGDDATKSYPAMLEYLSNQIVAERSQNRQLQTELAAAKADFQNEKAQFETQLTKYKSDLDRQVGEIVQVRQQIAQTSQARDQKYTELSKQVTAKQTELLKERELAQQKQAQLAAIATENKNKLEATQKVVREYTEFDAEAPDGKIVGVNQAKGTVWINLGHADGLRNMTTFSVYQHDVNNAQAAAPKAAIEVINIHSAHLAEARITEDNPVDPIIRDDRIFSPVFRPGRPDGFAIAGFIDIDGDERSDLDRLISLIKRNGGSVDVAVDDNGQRRGARMTPDTKFLVLGARPDENSEPKIINEFRKMLDEAAENGVRTISVADFLTFMGYEGRERTSGLGDNYDASRFQGRANAAPQPATPNTFKRRRTSAY